MRSLKEQAKSIEDRASKIAKGITRTRKPDEVQDLVFFAGFAFIFIGCWLSVHLGLSFVVCGALLVYLVLGAAKRG